MSAFALACYLIKGDINMNKRNFYFLATALTLALSPLAAHAADNDEGTRVKLSTGFDYSTGDYGDTQDTEITYIPVTAKAYMGDFTGSLTVPYVRIEGPGSVIGGGDASVQQTGTGVITTESGLGDVVAGLTYTVDLDQYKSYVDLTGKVKFPTADEDKGLGTGEADYTLLVEGTKMIGDAYVSAGLGRKFVGDSPALNLSDVWLGSVGAGYQVTPQFGVGASYDYRESAGSGENPSEMTAFATYKVTPDVSVQAYGVAGFSDGSPDHSVGMQIGYKLPPF